MSASMCAERHIDPSIMIFCVVMLSQGAISEHARQSVRPTVSVLACLAGLAVVLFTYQLIAVVGYIADGPRISLNRNNLDFYWWSARVVETIVVLSVAVWVAYVLRDRRRTGRLGVERC